MGEILFRHSIIRNPKYGEQKTESDIRKEEIANLKSEIQNLKTRIAKLENQNPKLENWKSQTKKQCSEANCTLELLQCSNSALSENN